VAEVTGLRGGARQRPGKRCSLDDEEVRAACGARRRLASSRQAVEPDRSQNRCVDSQIREIADRGPRPSRDNLGRVVEQAYRPGPESPAGPAQAQQRLAQVTLGRDGLVVRQGAASRQSLDQDRHASKPPERGDRQAAPGGGGPRRPGAGPPQPVSIPAFARPTLTGPWVDQRQPRSLPVLAAESDVRQLPPRRGGSR